VDANGGAYAGAGTKADPINVFLTFKLGRTIFPLALNGLFLALSYALDLLTGL
jgi:hypothetical protein